MRDAVLMLIPVGFANFISLYSFSDDAEAMQNAIGLDVSDVGGDYQAALEFAADAWAAALAPQMSNQVTIGPYELVVGQDGGDPITVEYSATTVGADGDFPVWPNTAVLVRKTTALGGRRNRGRVFIPGLAIRPDISPGGIWGGAGVAQLQTALDGWVDDVSGSVAPGPTPPVLLHAMAPGTPTPITGLAVQTRLATQRRRLRP